MSFFHQLPRMHPRTRGKVSLTVFTVMTRVLLEVGFLPSGTTKILGNRFTVLGTETPVGYFFEAFFQSGGWYRTVGWAQIIAALLILFPPTAHLGALLFLPIIYNIWVITVAVGFQGTWVITSLMLLANLWLLAWEYDRLGPLLRLGAMRVTRATPRTSPVAALFAALAAIGSSVLVLGRVARLNESPGGVGVVLFVLMGGAFGGLVATLAGRVPMPGSEA